MEAVTGGNGVFVTKDIDLAAYLHAKQVKIVDVRKNEANKTVFVFANMDGSSNRMMLAFYNHDDQISASTLLQSYQQVKNLLFDQSREVTGIARKA